MGDRSVPTTSYPSGLVLKFQMPGWEDLIDFVSPALLVELVSFGTCPHSTWNGTEAKNALCLGPALPPPYIPSVPDQGRRRQCVQDVWCTVWTLRMSHHACFMRIYLMPSWKTKKLSQK